MHRDYENINLGYYKNDFRDWNKDREIEYNNNEIRYAERYRFFQNAFDFLAANFVKGSYMEFGCHKARTFRIALSEARKKNFDSMNFYAFDSFEGLPESKEIDKAEGWQKGALTTTENKFMELIREHGVYADRVKTIKGFYSESLTDKLTVEFSKDKPALIYVDCDFYESTKDVLKFIPPLLQEGTILCFDDWNLYKAHPRKGQKRAFKEFKEFNPEIHFEEFVNIGWMGKSFITVKDV